jgi:hypothetical protein
MYLFFIGHLDLINSMGENPLLGPLEGLGSANPDFLGPNGTGMKEVLFE